MDQYQLNFTLSSIKTLSFSIKEPTTLDDTSKDFNINYEISPKLGINYDDKEVKLIIDVTGELQSSKEEILSSSIEFIFTINNLEELVFVKEGGFEIKDAQWTVVILSLALSTLRGIIFAKSEGTVLQKKHIPVLDPNTFIKKPEKTEVTPKG